MPQPSETRKPPTEAEAFYREAVAFYREIEARASAAMKVDFTATLKSLNKVRLPPYGVMTVLGGVVEKLPSGQYDAALDTDEGRVVIRSAKRTDRATDPQFVSSSASLLDDAAADSSVLTPDQLLDQLANAGTNPPCRLLCEAELTRFVPSQHEALLPLLWRYILNHRNSNDRDELVAVGSAIRKYIAIMPMDRMGELAVLLKSGNRSPLPIELEIEVAKMVYRNFEVHPPVDANPQPELAQRLLEIVQAYTNPRILLRDKHSAAASLAIEAIVSMRSSLAEQAWQAAISCPYRWFAELVSDDLDDLHKRWSIDHPDAAAWLGELRNRVVARV
ncbi:MAG: hypothetical protein IID44_04355 [Planctomycetes bacterium]|nr:hypothetical protein [Planctomycetota bacterium]